MKFATILLVLLAMCKTLNCDAADPAIRTNSAQQKLPQIKITFVEDAKLTEREVKDVISLARQCGIDQPSEVRTFHYLPTSTRGIDVKSVEVVKGADVTFDTLVINNTGWINSEPDKDSKRIGKFWASPSNKYTTHLRVYDFRKEKIRVEIGPRITTELADKIVPLIAAKKVRYPDSASFDPWRKEIKQMLELKLSGLSKQQDGKLWLHFEGQLDALQFRFEDSEVILEQVIHIMT